MLYNQHISITVDGIVFTFHKGSLQVLLIQRLIDPYKNKWALPGGFVLDNESLDQAIYRELQEETNINNVYLEQLYTFSGVDRDPRGRVISSSYLALMRYEDIVFTPGSDAKDVQLFSIDKLPDLAFDHKMIVDYAIQRLQYKLEYTNAAQYILPKGFTLTELHQLYEVVFQRDIDIRNFKKKILKLEILQPTGVKVVKGVHRPAMLYEFINKNFEVVEIL